MASKTATVLAEYLLTEEGNQTFLREYNTIYANWRDFFTTDPDNPTDHQAGDGECAIYALQGALDHCARVALPDELDGSIEKVFSGFDALERVGWDRHVILRTGQVEIVAGRIDKFLGGHIDKMPAEWR